MSYGPKNMAIVVWRATKREKKAIVAVDKCSKKFYLEGGKRDRIVPRDGIGSWFMLR